MTQDTPAAEAQADEVLPLVEETVRFGTRERVTGRVRVSITTEVVEELAQADLRSDVVEVTRVPIDRPVDTAPDIRTEGDVTIVPVLEEILIVEKRLVLRRSCTSGAASRPKPSRCRLPCVSSAPSWNVRPRKA